MQERTIPIGAIAGFGLTSGNAARLSDFYQKALGAKLLSSERVDGVQFESLMGVRGGAIRQRLKLGDESIDILQFDTPGQPYPPQDSPYSAAFQHFAIVVSDMDAAMAHLQGIRGWQPLSRGGPQHLPQSSGGVTAFKVQDPDGHPLEFLAFPAAATPPPWQQRKDRTLFLGIDHSAISVRDTAVSVEFYRHLGFTITGRSSNRGIEQERLDGVSSPQLEVTALSALATTPHLELLGYRSHATRPRAALACQDVAATRIYLALDSVDGIAGERLLTDPDGHHLHLVSRPMG